MKGGNWTPGPWDLGSRRLGTDIIGPDGRRLAHVHTMDSEGFGNACLIAAAPEMARCLAIFAEIADLLPAEWRRSLPLLAKKVDCARAVLRRARGEPS